MSGGGEEGDGEKEEEDVLLKPKINHPLFLSLLLLHSPLLPSPPPPSRLSVLLYPPLSHPPPLPFFLPLLVWEHSGMQSSCNGRTRHGDEMGGGGGRGGRRTRRRRR